LNEQYKEYASGYGALVTRLGLRQKDVANALEGAWWNANRAQAITANLTMAFDYFQNLRAGTYRRYGQRVAQNMPTAFPAIRSALASLGIDKDGIEYFLAHYREPEEPSPIILAQLALHLRSEPFRRVLTALLALEPLPECGRIVRALERAYDLRGRWAGYEPEQQAALIESLVGPPK
jgi:hypothetical protein